MSLLDARKLDEAKFRKETFETADAIAEFPNASPAKAGDTMVKYLNALLSNEFTLFTKTLNYHWNVTGLRFHSIHQFLGEHYQQLLKEVDSLAERIREVGGNPMGTLTELKRSTSLVERPGVYPETSIMLADLMSDHETIQVQIKTILKEIKAKKSDPGTEDYLTTLLKKHEEMGWMLKAHLG